MMKIYILLVTAFVAVSFGKVNPLLKKGAAIKDIGNTQQVQYIQTPFTQISYRPTLNIVNNVIVYVSRTITSSACDIDALGHESCPINKEQCPATKEYVTGSSTRGEEYLSCGALHSSSYYNPGINKCILPSSSAKVCKNYTGYSYDSVTDKCKKLSTYQPSVSYNTVSRSWLWCDLTCNYSHFLNTMLPVILAAGGTTILKSVQQYKVYGITVYGVTTDATLPFYIKVDSGAWMKVNPGEPFYIWEKGLMNAAGVAQMGGATPTLYFQTNVPVYVCDSGYTQYLENSVPSCKKTSYATPKCDVSFFPQRNNDTCRGDKKKYAFYIYTCPTVPNIYNNQYYPLEQGGDCGENNLAIDANSDGVLDQCNDLTPPTNNCERVNHTCPLDPTKTCVTEATKRLLVNPAKIIGEYKSKEYGLSRDAECSNPDKNCLYSIESISGSENTLCFRDKRGQEGCFTAKGECKFDGVINDYLVHVKPLLSFLNSPDEVVDGYHKKIEKDFDSPTQISLDFDKIEGSTYPLEAVKKSAIPGEQITVDFWIYWEGGNGIALSFGSYNLWYSQGSLGFNSSEGALYGIGGTDFMKNSWHRISAVFTHKDIVQNELYIDGIKQTLSEQRTDTLHNPELSDITGQLILSGLSGQDTHTLKSKIAGLNIYDGRLSPEQIKRLNVGGSKGGVSRLRIHDNAITGYDIDNTDLGTITSTCQLSGKVGGFERTVPSSPIVIADPIISAKVIDNRISFWGSYNNAEEMGFIEVMKYVKPMDIIDGYRHEFEDEEALYSKGFTGFISGANDMTYAISANPMTISECKAYIQGTKYFIAERDISDSIGIKMINLLSLYSDHSFGEYCIIQRKGMYGNLEAKYAVTDATGVDPAYYCSPWNCEDNQCGYASCQGSTDGNLIKDEDKVNLLSSVCLGQKCDYTSPYFRYCGRPDGCDTNDPTIMEAADGTCKKATCDGDDLFSRSTGSCEKLGCEYIEMDGKCVKKLY